MAETVDLDDWELLSSNSSCKDEFDEADLIYFDYFSKDLERRGEISDAENSVKFDYGKVMDPVVGDSSGENLLKSSSDFNSETLITSDKKELGVDADPDKDCSDLSRGFAEKDANFVRDNPIEEFAFSVDCDEEDSIGELGFGEMEVLNEFYLNPIDGGIVNYEKSCLVIENNLKGESEQFYSENLCSSVLPFQGVDNSDSVFSSERNGEILGWEGTKPILTKVRKEKGGFFVEMGSQIKISNGDYSKELNGIKYGTNSLTDDCSNLAKDPKEENISFDGNKPSSTEGETGNNEKDLTITKISKVPGGEKEEKVVLAWWKMPLEVIKYCVFGVRPVWSISMAMGFLGFLMFSGSYYLHKMKHKDSKTRPPMKVRFDEKTRSMVQTRAARLNKAAALFRPDPILRTPLHAFGITPFPAMSSFQWAP